MNTAHLLSLLVFAVMLTMLAAKPRYSIYERVARLEDWKQKMEDSPPLKGLNREYDEIFKRSCVRLGGTGCEANDDKCCREGDPHFGKKRKCVNVGSFSGPSYKCVEP
ncbi:uncharacterized protein LOC124447058 [Xenia sp. Carnegie-2017]|uniref:uncharacterized protein LOC124447058 n=1 Tax=Xenia sp. Carnegie-2017 TaxID=2897299 RepID=UPI001F03F800|nr:uncharacterized protein LOC124447058 [Xenia sp. Carnegie-2017]XP_046853916.1 uncharacterized protein LOC124447058 [Xenia sp. Carnegie-2017]